MSRKGADQRGARTKYWCFTLNNPTIAEEIYLKTWLEHGADFLIFGRERGENGVYHFQGYVELTNRQRLSGVRKLSKRAHWEPRRGSQRECIEYCKKDGDFFETGVPTSDRQGKRNDLQCIKEKLDGGASALDIANEHFSKWVIYRRSFDAYVGLKDSPRHRPNLRVFLLCGASGSGKSSYCFTRHPDCWISTSPVLRWFDGYDRQRVALIDDFNGECPFRFLLRLLDVYPIRVEVKGGHVAWNPEIIFITSNKLVREWYGGERDVTPIERRITHTIYMDQLENSEIGAKHDEIDQILEEY